MCVARVPLLPNGRGDARAEGFGHSNECHSSLSHFEKAMKELGKGFRMAFLQGWRAGSKAFRCLLCGASCFATSLYPEAGVGAMPRRTASDWAFPRCQSVAFQQRLHKTCCHFGRPRKHGALKTLLKRCRTSKMIFIRAQA